MWWWKILIPSLNNINFLPIPKYKIFMGLLPISKELSSRLTWSASILKYWSYIWSNSVSVLSRECQFYWGNKLISLKYSKFPPEMEIRIISWRVCFPISEVSQWVTILPSENLVDQRNNGSSFLIHFQGIADGTVCKKVSPTCYSTSLMRKILMRKWLCRESCIFNK